MSMHEKTTAVATRGIGGDLLAKYQSGIAQSRATLIPSGGKPFLRLLKDGGWVFGQTDDSVQEGSSWAVNILSISHGYCCWPKNDGGMPNKPLGEVMSPIHEPRPSRPEPISGFPFTDQRSMDLRCLDGEDQGTEVQYKINSVGGLRMCDELLAKIQAQLEKNPNYPCPVVLLQADHYQHKVYGRIYVPILEIVDWCDLTGKLQSDAAAATAVRPLPETKPEPKLEPEPVKTPEPPKAAKPAKAAKPPFRHPADKPAPTAPAPTAARRRPVRR